MLASSLLGMVAAIGLQGAQDPVSTWQGRLAEMARPDRRHGTFGPTGRRLWVTRLEPRPGLRGEAHYIHAAPALGDPLVVELTDGEGGKLVLQARASQWQPTHSVTRYVIAGRPGARVEEVRWITEDDVFVSRIEVDGLSSFGVDWWSPLATAPTGDPARFTLVPLEGRAEVRLLTTPLLSHAPPSSPIWIEAERPLRQFGSNGVDRKRAASGGEVLGQNFGAAAGHQAVYRFVSTGVGRSSLLARYARALPGEARFTVRLGGRAAGKLRCGSSGGWGDREADFAVARLDLGVLAKGLTELTIEADADLANTNFDGFLLVSTEHAAEPPPRASWARLDPMRGGLLLPGGVINRRGVPFRILPESGVQALRPGKESLPIEGVGARLHVLAIACGPAPRLTCGGVVRSLGAAGPRPKEQVSTLTVPAKGKLALVARDCLVFAVTRERVVGEIDAQVRSGRCVFHGVSTAILAGLHGLADPSHVTLAKGETKTFHVTLEFSGEGEPGTATTRALAATDPLADHRRRYASWFAANAPSFESRNELLRRLWVYRWFLVRHNLAYPQAGKLSSGPVIYEGRHGGWYPRVITFSTPHIIAETRWLADRSLFLGNVLALLHAQRADGILPSLLVDAQSARYCNWIPEAVVEAFKVRPDAKKMAELLPALVRNVEGLVRRFDADGDGLLSPDGHYPTGMEFQPSFWALQGYDDSRPPTRLERPDFTAYVHGSARALAEALRVVGRKQEAARMARLAARLQAAAVAKLWHDEDAFFYSVERGAGVPARCKEVVGFYPFRFHLAPDEPRFRRALAALVDPSQFWTPFPVASCSRQVPVFSAAVQRWPGPGGVATACMWNGPTWPHADSLVADAMAVVLREYGESAITARKLGSLLLAFGRFHLEEGDVTKPLLREYGDGITGVNQGCPDYMHSTFNDLLIRHAGGLVPRFDEVLEVRPLALGFGDLAFEGIPYHGRRLGIKIEAGTLTVSVDGRVVGSGPARDGLVLRGVIGR